MKITSFISTTLALAAFSCVTFVNCPAETTDKTASENDQRVYTFNEVSVRPKVTKPVGPDMSSFNRNAENTAVIGLIVETDGSVSEAKVEQASSPSFGKAALEAAKKWQFTPGQIEGKAVRTKITIPFKVAHK